MRQGTVDRRPRDFVAGEERVTRPGYDKEARLAEVTTDPTGWGAIDLGDLLEAWGFRKRSLGVSFGCENWLWEFPNGHRRLVVVVPGRDPVAVPVVDLVVYAIQESRRLSR